MKKRVLSVICTLFVLSSMVLNTSMNANAEQNGDLMVEGSFLTNKDSSIGTSYNPMLRGKHLMEGESGISKAGIGRIYAYGQTTADHVVDFTAVLVYVERYLEDKDAWGAVENFSEDARNKYYVIADATLKVDRGYFYRVHSEHIAGNDDDQPYDTAVSATDGIWIP